MIDFFGTVEGEDIDVSTLMPADDAQAAEEISAEDLLGNLTENAGAQTAVNEGDGDPGAQAEPVQETQQEQDTNDKFSRRISAALRSQKEEIFRGLGMSETEVRELIRAHKAEQMHKDDPEISPKAAQEILKLREQTQAQTNPQVEEYKAGINSLIQDGWTRDMLVAFTSDAAVRENLESGMTIRQAATAYMFSQHAQPAATQTVTKKAVPTVRTATASAPPNEDRFAEMSDKDFDAFAKRARDAAIAGKKVTFR